MPHKKYLLILLGIVFFALAALLGFYGPDWLAAKRERTAIENFTLPSIPEETFKAFAKEFSRVRAAEGPMRLPDREFLAPRGKRVTFASFEGKPLLVNFWATWCAPCIIELPSLQKLEEHYKGRMDVIAISLDPVKKQPDIAAFLEKGQISDFAGYFDESGRMGTDLELRGIPTSFLIGKNGQILYRFEGDADWSSAESQAFFDVFLAGSVRQNGE